MALVWGPDHGIRLFNRRFLGLVPGGRLQVGRPAFEALPEAESARRSLDRARSGERVRVDNLAVPFGGPRAFEGNRYYDVTFTPVREPNASPGGVLVSAVETTAAVRRRVELQHELERHRHVARVMQHSLLTELPSLDGIEACARYLPGGPDAEVGGDWYDLFPVRGGRVALAVGDVAGRGLPAATVMGQARAALRAYALEDPDPMSVLSRLNELYVSLELDMTTVAYGVLDQASRRLSYATAGHLPPLLLERDGSARFLDEGRNPPLGTACEPRAQAEAELHEGSTILLFTDGVVEVRGESLEVGLDRLRAQATGLTGGGVDELCGGLLDGDEGPPADDRALLAVRLVA
jgi:serine phosphatase RsbU (regulator of sigma subunit)